MSGVEVIISDTSKNPRCPHGPTLLFSRRINGEPKRFFACSACRDRKDCGFFLWEDQLAKFTAAKQEVWMKLPGNQDSHRKLFQTFNEISAQPSEIRVYCHTCEEFQLEKFKGKHAEHNCNQGVSDYLLKHPSELLKPMDNDKKEAQYLFAKSAITTIVDIVKAQGIKYVICIGAPRIHEFISSSCEALSSLLLDIDSRYHNFFGPLEFCWFNSFNNHFFYDESKRVFKDFIKNRRVAIVTDPPFGGRVEPLAATFKSMDKLYKRLNDTEDDVPIFWTFPYFMEPQILNSCPEFSMLDYKVDYDNHSLFSRGDKGRKHGSPVRIFTNLAPSKIVLPSNEGYSLCVKCDRWVASENRHCDKCRACTSKDGRTYVHCDLCSRCVKPTWQHCTICGRCTQRDHQCGTLSFQQECFHCKEKGHKKRDCPKINVDEIKRKRKAGNKTKRKKLKV